MEASLVTRPKRPHRPPKRLTESASEEQLDTELWSHARQLDCAPWAFGAERACGAMFPTRSSASGVERLRTPDRSEGEVLCYQDLRQERQDRLEGEKPASLNKGGVVSLQADCALRLPCLPFYRRTSTSSREEQHEWGFAQSGAATARSSVCCAPSTPCAPEPPRKRFRSYSAQNPFASQAGMISLLAGAAWVEAVEALAVAGKLAKIAAAGKAGRR